MLQSDLQLLHSWRVPLCSRVKDPGRLGAVLAFASRLLLRWSKEQQPFYPEWKEKKQERQGEQKETISLGEPHKKGLVCFLNMCGSNRAGLQAVGSVRARPNGFMADGAADKRQVPRMRWCLKAKRRYAIK